MTEIRAMKIDGQVRVRCIPDEDDTVETLLVMYSGISANVAINMIRCGIEPKEITKWLLSAVEAGIKTAIEEIHNESTK